MEVCTVFSVDSSPYLHWQSELLCYSHRQAKVRGPLIRLCAGEPPPLRHTCTTITCEKPELASTYSPANKPSSLLQWVGQWPDDGPGERPILLIDPDCCFVSNPLLPMPEPGHPYAEYVSYMQPGISHNEWVSKFGNVKDVQPVGIPILMHPLDMEAIVGPWWEMLNILMADEEAVTKGGWVIEMWAYVLAAATIGLRHEVLPLQALTSSENLLAPLIHYPYGTEMDGWVWDKRAYEPWTKPTGLQPKATPPARFLHDRLQEVASLFGNRKA